MSLIPNAYSQTTIKFLKFCMVGLFVYFVDALLFLMLLNMTHATLLSRVGSTAVAMTVSWWLNKIFTFSDTKSVNNQLQLARFMVSQTPGALTNIAVSTMAYIEFGLFKENPFLSVALGSCAGLAVNFMMANQFVFKNSSK